MTDSERIEACTRLLITAAREAGMRLTGDLRLSEADTATLVGLAPGSLRNMRIEGGAPVCIRAPVSGSRVSYRLADVAVWIESRRVAW